MRRSTVPAAEYLGVQGDPLRDIEWDPPYTWDPPRHPYTKEPLRLEEINIEDIHAALMEMRKDLLKNPRKSASRLKVLYWLVMELWGELQATEIEMEYLRRKLYSDPGEDHDGGKPTGKWPPPYRDDDDDDYPDDYPEETN